jgi:hypothetical protein
VPGEALDFDVTVLNDKTGHSIPSGVSFSREMWIEVTLRDGAGNAIYRSGSLDPTTGDLLQDPDLEFFGAIAYDANGAPTSMNFRAASIDESKLLPFRASRTANYSIMIPEGALFPLKLEVVLRFRPVRPSMIRELDLERLLPIEIFEMARFTRPLHRLENFSSP